MRYVNMDKPSYNPKTEIITPDYKIEDGTFISGWKVEKKPDEDGYIPTPEEQLNGAPTLIDRIEAQVLYTALMTDTLLEE